MVLLHRAGHGRLIKFLVLLVVSQAIDVAVSAFTLPACILSSPTHSSHCGIPFNTTPPRPGIIATRMTTTSTTFQPKNNVSSLAMMTEPNDVMSRSEAIVRSLAYPLSFVAAFRIGAALSVIGQPRLPPLESSSNKISNGNGNGNSNEDPEEVIVGSHVSRLPSGARIRLFYPSRIRKGEEISSTSSPISMAPYCTDGRATSDGMAGLVGFRQLGLSFLLAHLADASSGCYDKVSAPIIKNDKTNAKEGTFPLLVYSHGFGGNMDMGTYFLRQIASKGIVVAAVEHTDGTASSTVLKDGTILPFSPGMQSGREQLSQRSDEILEASVLSNLPPDFQSMIDTNRVFLGGHSYGAPSALLASARAKKNISGNLSINIAGLVLHDPALAMGYGMLTTEDLTAVPTISYTSDEYNRGGVKCGNLTLHVRGAFHGNFVDAPLWAPLWVMRLLSTVIPACGPADPMEVHEELAQSLSAFVETGRVDSASVMKGHLFEFIAR